MTTTVNGRVTDQRTAEQVDDVNLLVRAGLVRRMCLEGGDRSLASRAQVVEAVRRAGRAAAVGGAAEVEGVLVGLEGVVGIGPGAPAGWYPDPDAAGMLRWWDGRAWTENRTPIPSSTVLVQQRLRVGLRGSRPPGWARGTRSRARGGRCAAAVR